MKFEIKSRWTGSVLFSLETSSMKLCVEAAVKSGANLSGATLSFANLSGANLSFANLYGADLGEEAGKLKAGGFFTAGPLGSGQSYLLAFHTDKGVFIRTGCFFDSLEAFRAATLKTHGADSKHGKLYLDMANLIEYKFSDDQ